MCVTTLGCDGEDHVVATTPTTAIVSPDNNSLFDAEEDGGDEDDDVEQDRRFRGRLVRTNRICATIRKLLEKARAKRGLRHNLGCDDSEASLVSRCCCCFVGVLVLLSCCFQAKFIRNQIEKKNLRFWMPKPPFRASL